MSKTTEANLDYHPYLVCILSQNFYWLYENVPLYYMVYLIVLSECNILTLRLAVFETNVINMNVNVL